MANNATASAYWPEPAVIYRENPGICCIVGSSSSSGTAAQSCYKYQVGIVQQQWFLEHSFIIRLTWQLLCHVQHWLQRIGRYIGHHCI